MSHPSSVHWRKIKAGQFLQLSKDGRHCRNLTVQLLAHTLRSAPCLNLLRRQCWREHGVIEMALLSVIRRWHFREGMSIREISKRTGLSRNTVRRYLREGTVEPKFKVPDRASFQPLRINWPGGCEPMQSSRVNTNAPPSGCMQSLSNVFGDAKIQRHCSIA